LHIVRTELKGASEMASRETEPKTFEELVEVFGSYGAPDPEEWARLQLEEGIPQLAIASFARAMWAGVADEGDDRWIDQEIERTKDGPLDPCAQIGPALAEMLSRGVSRHAIIDLVRVAQYGALLHVAALIDGSVQDDLPVHRWRLYQVDDDDRLVANIRGLSEVLPSLDPTGREMCPRGSDTL
jgi:hypothetical protein